MRYLGSAFFQIICSCLLLCPVQAQNISFYPVSDTIIVNDGCTGSEFICTVATGFYSDSIIISPGFNTWMEYLDSTGHIQSLEQCYFLVADSSNQFNYEIWYFPLRILPYFQQLQFDSAFVNWEEYFELMLIVKLQGIPVDSLKQLFKNVGGLGIPEDQIENIDASLVLYPNYPNPFNSQTVISFFLPEKSQVKLLICDILGKRIATLLDSYQPPGYCSITWKADNLNSGIYYVYYSDDKSCGVQKCLLEK